MGSLWIVLVSLWIVMDRDGIVTRSLWIVRGSLWVIMDRYEIVMNSLWIVWDLFGSFYESF